MMFGRVRRTAGGITLFLNYKIYDGFVKRISLKTRVEPCNTGRSPRQGNRRREGERMRADFGDCMWRASWSDRIQNVFLSTSKSPHYFGIRKREKKQYSRSARFFPSACPSNGIFCCVFLLAIPPLVLAMLNKGTDAEMFLVSKWSPRSAQLIEGVQLNY